MKIRSLVFLTFLLAVNLATIPANAQTTATAQWPTHAWPESSPEAQGVSSGDLADALEFARTHDINIHSLTVVRNGVVVLDAYFYPFARDLRHDVASVTKSIVSLLTGIATSERRLSGLDEPVVAVLPATVTRGLERQKRRLRLGNLLAMQSGLGCGFNPGERELREMRRSKDWVAYALRLPQAAAPGQRFGYCSPNFHVLSAALSTATHVNALEYARVHLFAPLGIQDVYWPADPLGITHGWGDLQLRPRDMAKIGLLMLREGQWEHERIVPKAWIDSSLTVHARVNEREDYGLGWWLSRRVATLFEANGRGGQRISVLPAKNVVIVTTGGGFEPGDIGGYLLTAVRSDTALPDDPKGQARLAETLRSIATAPNPHAVVQSAVAQQVSHSVYTLEENPLGIRSLAVEFSDSARAVLRLRLSDGTVLVQPLGLDGVYRVASDERGASSAGRGEWLPSGRFRAELNTLARINRYVFDIDFRGEDVDIAASESTELGTVTLRGTTRSAARR